jgi:hypothetical protein
MTNLMVKVRENPIRCMCVYMPSLGVHVCTPSYSGGIGKRMVSLRAAQAK